MYVVPRLLLHYHYHYWSEECAPLWWFAIVYWFCY